VLKGVEGGFAQAGHGRKDFISKPSKSDWVVFYSSKDKFENGIPLQKFTAIGKVVEKEPYQPNVSGSFKPYRRNVEFKKVKETEIRPLLEQLSFIKNKKSGGFILLAAFVKFQKKTLML
jgi:hypothetical protein